MDQQQFSPFLQALLYKSSSRVVIYVPGYYEENNGKTREKKAEMAVHMAAKVAIATPQLGPGGKPRRWKGVFTPIRWKLLLQ